MIPKVGAPDMAGVRQGGVRRSEGAICQILTVPVEQVVSFSYTPDICSILNIYDQVSYFDGPQNQIDGR